MYTDEDLNYAVKKGVFSAKSVDAFRLLLSEQKNAPAVDEENFKLIGGFNDIFVVIACLLLLFSAYWVVESITNIESLGHLIFAGLSWFLAEFFVRKRKMALPAIVLMLGFVGSLFTMVVATFESPSENAYILASAVATAGAIAHWIRFKVPITVAAGAGAVFTLLTLVILSAFPEAKDWLLSIIFVGGLLIFYLAMRWDAKDTKRITHHSDVAFWLHLLAAPLIIHPVFSNVGVLDGSESLGGIIVVVVLFIVTMLISIAIDRRAFMVSALIYLLYAIASLIQLYGGVGYSFALTGVLIGGMLLLLTAFWHKTRAAFVAKLPDNIQHLLPEIQKNQAQ